MAFLYHASVFLRNFLVKQHPYFSCCASCGEIKTPLDKRLCTSLAFSFPVDAVLVPDDASQVDGTLAGRMPEVLNARCPWLRRIFIVGDLAEPTPPLPDNTRVVSMDSISPRTRGFDLEAYLHLLPDISEYYLIIRPGFSPKRDLLPLDFFTPNGIPLLRLAATPETPADFTFAEDAMPQTRENSMGFLDESGHCHDGPANERYAAKAGRWAFRTGRAVPVASDMSARS